ncbi:MAG: transposase family protein [bacterium]
MMSDSSDSSSTSSSDSISSSDGSDSSDDFFLEICTLSLLLSEREVKRHRLRVAWEDHATILQHEKQFEAKYRMPYEAFMKLAKLLEPNLSQDSSKSLNSCGQPAICHHHILGLTIRWLSGGSYHDIRDAGNFSSSSFFRLLKKGLFAILNCVHLAITLPETEEDLVHVAEGFKYKSTEGVMAGCVGALDGMLLLIRTPSRDEISNVRQFFSGHYQRMGINVQGLVDSNLRFLYVGVLGGGRSSDYKVYQRSKVKTWIENLPPMFFVAGDNAYVCSEHLLTPFCGNNRSIPENDAYNFYLSQLRIRVEMAFGLLKTKWRILRSPLEVPLADSGNVLLACCMLHYYCINQRLQVDNEVRIERFYGEGELQLGYVPSDIESSPHNGSVLHTRIVQRVQNKALSRPELNVQRRNFEDARKAMYFTHL